MKIRKCFQVINSKRFIWKNITNGFKSLLGNNEESESESLDLEREFLEETLPFLYTLEKYSPGTHFIEKNFNNELEMCEQSFNINPHTKEEVQVLIRKFLKDQKKALSEQPYLREINLGESEAITIVGDTHGQLTDTFNIFLNVSGPPSPQNKYLFLGDYVDRGPNQWLNIMTLLYLQSKYPEDIILLRGNHEERNLNFNYGFFDEIRYLNSSVAGDKYLKILEEIYEVMPHAAVVDCANSERLFCTHGGIGFPQYETITLDDIREINPRLKKHYPYDDEDIVINLLWSDPSEDIIELGRNRRGASFIFGRKVTETFLKNNELDMIVRSHEATKSVPDGFLLEHEGKCLTIFSASNYGGMNNAGAVLKVFGGDQESILYGWKGNQLFSKGLSE